MFERKSENGLGLIPIFIIGAFIVLVPVALITTTIRVAVSEQSIYDYSVKRYDAHLVSGVPEEELLRANGEIHQYLTGDYDGPLSIPVRYKDGSVGPLFNAGSYPSMFVVGKDGKIAAAIVGNKAGLEKLVKTALDKALKGSTKQAKAGPVPRPGDTGALSNKQ